MNKWIEICDRIITLADRDSQIKYAESIKKQIGYNSMLYPTAAQKTILIRMNKHFSKLELSDVERQCLELSGDIC